jgi:hypothetical protein
MRVCGVLGVVTAGLVLAGCTRGSSTAGRAGLPVSGQVRVITTKLREDATHFSWLWTIIGERNWSQATTSPNELRLASSYPLNSRSKVGGTHIWEARITMEPASVAGGNHSYLMQVQLRGSNATMSMSSTPIDLGMGSSLTGAARVIQSQETTVSLPATITLASVGRKDITLKIER